MAYESKSLAELEEEKKSSASAYKSQIDATKALITKLANNVNNGYEYRNVECQIIYDDPVIGKKTYLRLDTNEIVKVEDMTKDEMQGAFDLGD